MSESSSSETSNNLLAVTNLTEEQKEFLKQCEEDFSNRFTDSDPEYVEVRDRVKSLPPIEDPYNSFGFRDRDGHRERDRDRDRRGDRDHHRNYRDGWRNRYNRDNYHSRFDHRHRDDNYSRYRSSYHSNYYRKS